MHILYVLTLLGLSITSAAAAPIRYSLTVAFTDVQDQGSGSSPNPLLGNSLLFIDFEISSPAPTATGPDGRGYNISSFSVRIDNTPIFPSAAGVTLLDPHNSVTNWAGILMQFTDIYNPGDSLDLVFEGPPLYFGGPLLGYGLETGTFPLTEIAGLNTLTYRDNRSPTSCCVIAGVPGTTMLIVADVAEVPEPSYTLLAGLALVLVLTRNRLSYQRRQLP